MKNLKIVSRPKRIIKVTLISILILVIIIVGGFYMYTLDYYRASPEVSELLSNESSSISMNKNLTIVKANKEKDLHKGLIFYPGGKVEASAYLPLLKQLSDEGLTCILVKMPMNLAVFNVNAANKIIDEFTDLDSWYLAGHSLGGAMASSYVEKYSDKVDGLILLGAYPLNTAEENVLVIYGSEDIKLDLTRLETTKNKIEILGGNHAYFGNYGEQEGDGIAVMSRSEQQGIAVKEIISFIK
jgi:hypothetical protein